MEILRMNQNSKTGIQGSCNSNRECLWWACSSSDCMKLSEELLIWSDAEGSCLSKIRGKKLWGTINLINEQNFKYKKWKHEWTLWTLLTLKVFEVLFKKNGPTYSETNRLLFFRDWVLFLAYLEVVAKSEPELLNLLPPFPKWWNFRHKSSCLIVQKKMWQIQYLLMIKAVTFQEIFT